MFPPSPSTPSNPRSRPAGAAPTTPPQHGVYTPTAPHIGTAPLPPSPSTPTHPHGHAYGAVPRAPYMGTVPLPMQTPAYGLYTPPATPTKRVEASDVPACLREGDPALIYWDMSTHPHTVQLPYGLALQSRAFSAQEIRITAFMGAREFSVVNPTGVTYLDVLYRIHQYMHQAAPSGVRFIDTLGPQRLFAGLAPTAPGRYSLVIRPIRP